VCTAGSPAETATFLDPTARVQNPQHVTLGERVFIGPFAEVLAAGDAPISIGAESDAQDNVLILGKRSGDRNQATRGEGRARPGVEIADRVIMAHGVSVIGPAQIGIQGTNIPADPDADQEVFLSFSSQVDGAVLEKNTGVSALARVGPGVRLRSGFMVLPGKNVTTQSQADNPALGKVRLVNEADVAFNEAVIEVNTAFAREYTQLYRDKPSNVRGANLDPGHTAFNRIGARSGAMLRTKPTTACFVSEYTGSLGMPVSPASDAVATIAPPPITSRRRSTPRTIPSTLTPTARR